MEKPKYKPTYKSKSTSSSSYTSKYRSKYSSSKGLNFDWLKKLIKAPYRIEGGLNYTGTALMLSDSTLVFNSYEYFYGDVGVEIGFTPLVSEPTLYGVHFLGLSSNRKDNLRFRSGYYLKSASGNLMYGAEAEIQYFLGNLSVGARVGAGIHLADDSSSSSSDTTDTTTSTTDSSSDSSSTGYHAFIGYTVGLVF